MAKVPSISTDPLEIFINRNVVEEPYINKYWIPALFGGMAFLGCCFSNWYMRRPVFSGFQQHIGLTSLATAGGLYYDKHRSGYLAERDAVFRDYIRLHPEDFPCLERKKLADVFERWVPIR
ncbi:hypothetical protein FQA39_LY15227 [Lamprigera yunnana]|nr:hypothetical protein FQA39_LY15227 [Lamprigera yunnana]